jgi:hypothetical protein
MNMQDLTLALHNATCNVSTTGELVRLCETDLEDDNRECLRIHGYTNIALSRDDLTCASFARLTDELECARDAYEQACDREYFCAHQYCAAYAAQYHNCACSLHDSCDACATYAQALSICMLHMPGYL